MKGQSQNMQPRRGEERRGEERRGEASFETPACQDMSLGVEELN
jgi:hypothetical protein